MEIGNKVFFNTYINGKETTIKGKLIETYYNNLGEKFGVVQGKNENIYHVYLYSLQIQPSFIEKIKSLAS